MLPSGDAFGKTATYDHWEGTYVLNELVVLGKEFMNRMLHARGAKVYM